MADDRLGPTRPGSPRLEAERPPSSSPGATPSRAELDATEQDLPTELVELAPPPGVKERVLWSVRAEGRDEPVLALPSLRRRRRSPTAAS